MARYLFEATYTAEGLKGLIAAGAKSRLPVVDDLASSVGGSIVSFDFANGGGDVYLVCDLPDDEAAAAITLTVGASGALSTFKLTKLFSAEQIEAAAARNAKYVPPGG
ncbi:MAG: GYD domain-containing protein [Acidimicrobiales bacterium]